MHIDVTEPEQGITLVTLNNAGKRNALDEGMFRFLAGMWRHIAASNTRCVVLTGADGAFCSGADLSQNLTELSDIDDLIEAALMKASTFPIPIVAAIEGACVAGGMELALSCDIRIASATAKFGLPEARWGIFPAGGGAIKLALEIGHGRASEMLLSGRIIPAHEALSMGLINRVVPEGSALEDAFATARAVAANSPVALRAIKRYLNAARQPSAELITLERELTQLVRASKDAREGPHAFLEKRTPQYR